MLVSYVRCSDEAQNEARQLEALKKFNIEKWYIEKVSGKDTKREQLQLMLDFVREGDVIYVHDFSRLSRSVQDLLNIIETLDKKGVRLVSLKENLDTHTPHGKLMLTIIAAINEFERTNLLERQKEGIAIAKRDGRYKGGKCKKVPNFAEHYAQYLSRQISKADLAKKLGISRPTLDKIITEYNNNNLENPI
jgi:DNA invertase Pin-like site-specific DNA recombinase